MSTPNRIQDTAEWRIVSGVSEAIKGVVAGYRKQVAQVEGDNNVAPKDKREYGATLRKRASDQLAALQTDVEKAQTVTQARLFVTLKPKPRSEAQETIHQAKVTRATERVKALLAQATEHERGSVITAEIDRARVAGEQHTLDAISEGADVWLSAGHLTLARLALQAATESSYTSDQREAARQQDAFERVAYRANMALNQGADILSIPIEREAIVVGTEEGSVLTIDAQAPILPPAPAYVPLALRQQEGSGDRLYDRPIGEITDRGSW